MMGRSNSKLRRSLVSAFSAVALVAAGALVSSVALAAPEKATPEPAADVAGKAEGSGEAKGEKAAEKKATAEKAHEKAAAKLEKKKGGSKASKKRAAHKSDSKAKKGAKKSHSKTRGASSGDKVSSAAGSAKDGILLSKVTKTSEESPKESAHHEGSTKKASTSSKDNAHGATMKASVSHPAQNGEATAGKGSAGHAKKGSKKASSRGKGSRRREKKGESGDKESSNHPCFGPAVTVDRAGLEPEHFPLVTCKGEPLAEARERLSLLARPWGVVRPEVAPAETKPSKRAKTSQDHEIDPIEVAPGVRRIDEGLLSRLDAVARKFPGRVLSVVSGYRPQSRGSLHQQARAIDIRVAGVANEDLAAFCRSMPDTGCGYYPNSSFVHMDVRLPGTGSVSWIDASGPGEAPRYVARWPETAKDTAPPPFAPPSQGDATEMGHDLGSSGSPSATRPATCVDPAAPSRESKTVPASTSSGPLFEDPPY